MVQVLINNAGIPMAGPGQPFWLADVAAWRQMAYTNVFATFFLTQALFLPWSARIWKGHKHFYWCRHDGAEIFFPYGPSKAFVEAESKIWAQELADTGVQSTYLFPEGRWIRLRM